MKFFDTIAAIATPIGSGGVAIIRVSGDGAEDTAQKITRTKSGKSLKALETHKLTLASFCERDGGAVLDEGLIAVMRAPHSYTGETVVEINCHGGYYVAKRILGELLSSGARLAEAGEFTRRAFMNGKLDMIGAEAVMDVIDSNSSLGLGNAAKALGGALSEKIDAIREEILEITSNISAFADYPEEIEPLDKRDVFSRLTGIQNEIDGLIGGFETGRILRDGINAVIIGKPNVGKSSLMNALSRTERAIVTDIPGTTRDTIEEHISIKGAAMRLTDTAGIRSDASDLAEQIGIDRSLKNIETADLCLFVVDSSLELDDRDAVILDAIKDKNTIVILNKTDKATVIHPQNLKKYGFNKDDIIETSTAKDAEPLGIDKLENRIAEKFALGGIGQGDVFISNMRQRDSLVSAKNSIRLALEGIDMPFDLLYIDLEDALSHLGEVTGQTVQDEIIDRVFSRFCVGK